MGKSLSRNIVTCLPDYVLIICSLYIPTNRYLRTYLVSSPFLPPYPCPIVHPLSVTPVKIKDNKTENLGTITKCTSLYLFIDFK